MSQVKNPKKTTTSPVQQELKEEPVQTPTPPLPMPITVTEMTKPPADFSSFGAPAMSDAAKTFLAVAEGKREQPTRIPLIKINHKDGNFTLPSGEIVDVVAGYPVYYFKTRRFYEKSPKPGESSPPDCWSSNEIEPSNDSKKKQSELCADCKQNQWGTARDGRSKACGTFVWTFLLNPVFGNPPIGVVTAPSSSLKELIGNRFNSGYFGKAAAKYGVYEIVWTKFYLDVKGDQVQYSTIRPEMGEPMLNPENVRKMAALRNQFVAAMEEMRGTTPEIDDSADSE